MRNLYALKYKPLSCEKGFSLVEMAVVLLIFGMLLASGITIYKQYIFKERQEQTTLALKNGYLSVGGYVSLYGRYPCPAPANAVPGDVNYGRESRDPATGECVEVLDGVWKAESLNTALADRDVFIGALPFRNMNLSEDWIHDGYHNRLTYAVTGILTNADTFENINGGITVVDLDDNPLIPDNPDGAHFIVIAPGENNEGAIARTGAMIGDCTVVNPQQQNCDHDSVFRVGQKQEDFDDLVYYTATDEMEQWQLQNNQPQNIHMRRATDLALGVDADDPTGSLAEVEIRETTEEEGVIRIQSQALPDGSLDPGTGVAISANLCAEGGGNCFNPLLVYGDETGGGGMRCANPDEFIYKVSSNDVQCTSEIWFSCPDNAFFMGFNADGKILCSEPPPLSCPDQVMPLTCGGSQNITAVYEDGDWYGYGFSGACHRIAALDTAAVAAAPNIAAVQTIVDNMNAAPRTTQACAPTSNDALIRDTFACESGVWDTDPVRTIERVGLGDNTGLQPPLGGNVAELTGPAFVPSAPMSTDPSNSNNYHDCWCREDYRVDTAACAGGQTGTRFRIMRHNCPQTTHSWTRVYPTSSSYDTSGCGCTPTVSAGSASCASAFGLGSSHTGVTGNVTYQNQINCPSGNTTVVPGSYDYSNCACPVRAPSLSTTACPYGTTNSFTYNGVNYNNVSEIRQRLWVCPTGPAPQQPITSASQVGYYGAATVVHTQACNCNSTLTQDEVQACPAGYSGAGRLYRKPWNCATGAFDPAGPSNLVSNDCHLCVWQAGSPRTGIDSIPAPRQLNSACSSCSGSSSCFQVLGPDQYKIYDGCYCAGQP